MKLNGWQRLWVLATVIWGAGITCVALQSNWSESERYSRWANELLGYVASQAPELEGQSVTSLRGAYSTLTDKQLVESIHSTYLTKHPAYQFGFSRIDEKYAQTNSLGMAQINSLVIWGVLPPLVVYALGLALVWVRRGFKQGATKI